MIKSFLKYSAEIIFFIALAISFQFHKKIWVWHNVINADGKGYYAYLPAVFIYSDNQINFIDYYEKKYYAPVTYAEFRIGEEGNKVNKYFSGVAILLLPFFLIAHVIALIFTNLPADGYSAVYQYSVAFAGVFYLYIALKFISLCLKKFWHFSYLNIFIALFITFLGTNLFYYSIEQPSMSHVFSFALISLFIYSAYEIFYGNYKKGILLAGLSLGLIIAVRPVNVLIIIFLPFIAGNRKVLFNGIKTIIKNYSTLFLAFIIALLPIFIQLILWKWQTGNWIVYSYGNESFNFADPEIFNILFSFRKGWFLYTPIAFVAVFSIIVLLTYLKKYFSLISFLFFLGILTYVLSSWWTWEYGMSFGSRVYIDYYFIVSLGIALALSNLHRKSFKVLLVLLLVTLAFYNQIQHYQYRHFIIDWAGMDSRKYAEIFLKTADGYKGIYFRNPDTSKINKEPALQIKINFEKTGIFNGDENRTNKKAFKGKYSQLINNTFSTAVIIPAEKINITDSTVLQASVWFFGKPTFKTIISVHHIRNGKALQTNNIELKEFTNSVNKWQQAVIKYTLPKDFQHRDTLKVFVWNANTKEEIYIDDFEVEVFNF